MEKKTRKRKSIGERLLSLLMALAMVITMVQLPGAEKVQAADGQVKLYFELPAGTSADDWAVNVWGNNNETVTVTGGKNVRIGGTWKDSVKPSLQPSGNNWGYVTVSGNVAGLQFVKWVKDENDTSTKPTEYNCWNAQIAKDNCAEAYYDPAKNKWYKDSGKTQEIVEKLDVETAKITMHFQKPDDWEDVYAKLAEGSSWTAISGYAYANSWPGAEVEADANNSGWYSFTITMKGVQFNCIFNNKGQGQTGNIVFTPDKEVTEKWVTYDGTNTNVSDTAPTNWKESTSNPPIDPNAGSGISSPVVNEDGSVLIQYKKKDSDTFEKLYLMGTVTDWGDGKEMDYNAETGMFSIVINKKDAKDSDIVVDPGDYQYKFKSNIKDHWFTDPLNPKLSSDGNSVVSVPGMVINGHTTAGDGKYEFTAKGSESATVTGWGVYEDEKCTNAHTQINVTTDKNDLSKATIDTKGASTGYYYVKVTYNEGETQKEAIKQFYHTEKALIYEYTYKEDSKNKNKTDIYTWYNTPFNASFPIIAEGATDKKAAYVAVDENCKSFGYIARLYGAWGTNDREFSDRTINVHEGERYTKVRGGEGIEEPYVLSTGKTGYDNGIIFRYRDDALFYNGAMDTISSVKLMLKAPEATAYTAYDMTYDAENELYVYKLQNGADTIATGTYKFYYKVTFTDGEKAVQDLYHVPANADTVEGVKAAEIEYQKYDYAINTSVSPESGVNSNENPVVSVEVSRKDGTADINAIEEGEITSIIADISKLGYEDQKVNVSAITGKAALYVKDGVVAGTHEVPISILDKYGNAYETTATVKVVASTGSDPKWDESIIYFLLTDRFYDGSTANNTGVDKSLREDYHGGDFAGLIQKLDYIDSLGVNTIWITPVVDNIESFYSDEINQNVGGYAGYWACDFTKLDEHLGTTEEFDKLLDEAHARGIKIMLDIVVNHAGYDKNGDKEWTDDNSPFAGMIRPEAEMGSDSITQWLSGLPDFMTEKQEVRSKLIEWQKAWATHKTANGNSVDYFRVDTVKHVDHETWSQLKSAITEVNPDFKMIGEYFGASCINTGDYLADGQMDALLDFDFKSIAKQFVDGKIDSVETSLESRNTSINNAITMGQFLSSHDETGFLTSVGGDTDKMKVAAALELTAKGIPIIYYGEEINLTGDTKYGSDGNNRYDMQFDNLSTEQAVMLEHYKKLIAARNEKTKVFAKGNREKIAGSDTDGYLLFKRSYGSDFAYVGLNTTTEEKQVTVSVGTSIKNVKDLYSGKTFAVNGGEVNITIPASSNGGTVILVETTQQSSGGNSGGGSSSSGTPSTGKDDTTTPTTPDNTTVTTNPDGTTTETKTETVKNDAGNEVTVTVTTEKDADGNVTGSKEVSVIAEIAKNTSATVTVKKDADGNITSAKATVAVEGTKGKTNVTGTISGGVVSQIVDSADTKSVRISVKVKAGDKSYTVKADADELTAGAKLKVVAIDSKTKKYVLVNAKTYTVSKDGAVKVSLPTGKTYELVTGKEASTIEKQILNTVKVKKSSATVKKGKKTTLQMSSKLDMKNVSKITYTSSKKSVATVNKDGKVTAQKAGTATVKAKVTLMNGKTKTVTMKIKVK